MKTIAYLIPNAKHPNAVVVVGEKNNGGWIDGNQKVPEELIPLVNPDSPHTVVAYLDQNQTVIRIGKNANAGWIAEKVKPKSEWKPLVAQTQNE